MTHTLDESFDIGNHTYRREGDIVVAPSREAAMRVRHTDKTVVIDGTPNPEGYFKGFYRGHDTLLRRCDNAECGNWVVTNHLIRAEFTDLLCCPACVDEMEDMALAGWDAMDRIIERATADTNAFRLDVLIAAGAAVKEYAADSSKIESDIWWLFGNIEILEAEEWTAGHLGQRKAA